MMKRVGKIAAVVVLVVVAYRLLYPSVTIRYRLALEAEVDGQPRTGAGVIEVTYSKVPRIGGAALLGESVTVRGEAVILDLAPRGVLFALLKGGEDPRSVPESIVLRAAGFPHGVLPSPIDDGLLQLQKVSGKFEVPLQNLPMLVRFRDINDQMTVEKVDPFNIARNFGDGAKLVRATLEIVPAGQWPFNSFGFTGTPITEVIETRLPWLVKLHGRYLGGGGGSGNAPLELHGGNLKGAEATPLMCHHRA